MPARPVLRLQKVTAEHLPNRPLQWPPSIVRVRPCRCPGSVSATDPRPVPQEAAHELEKQQRRKALRELIAEGERSIQSGPAGRGGGGGGGLKKGPSKLSAHATTRQSGEYGQLQERSKNASYSRMHATKSGSGDLYDRRLPLAGPGEARKGSGADLLPIRKGSLQSGGQTTSPSTTSLPSVLPTLDPTRRHMGFTTKKK